MKTKLLFAFCVLFVCHLAAQSDYSFYLNQAKEKIEEGNCESAQKWYNVYKELTGKSSDFFEKLFIKDCHHDYTENAWDINMKMVWVEGGDFLMGCTSEQSDCCYDEQNVRRVTLDGFYIGMLEVTQAQWEKVVGTSDYQQHIKAKASWSMYGVGPDYPMYYVSWEEAMEFCRMLSNKTGKTYTLPTEAQWEYAARGGNRNEGTKYAGSNLIDAVAWHKGNSGDSTHPCGIKESNALGIYDMSGNVWEWCKDWYSDSYLSNGTNNPTGGPASGYGRVNRGGSCAFSASRCRVARRSYLWPSSRGVDLGFRVVSLP